MNIIICIGSSCHIKGSRFIVQKLQSLVAQNNLGDQVELAGAFCLGNCVKGVSVKVDDRLFSLIPEEVEIFFEKEILGRLG
ncbi:MAG: (2Fe-2S) ferredoxin domain-containing protein [Fusobacteriaceae bacterium]